MGTQKTSLAQLNIALLRIYVYIKSILGAQCISRMASNTSITSIAYFDGCVLPPIAFSATALQVALRCLSGKTFLAFHAMRTNDRHSEES